MRISGNFNITMNAESKGTDRMEAAAVQKTEQVSRQSTQTAASEESVKAPKSSDPNAFVFDFKKNEFNLVGATSKLEDIDVEKAMSDMKKETVLDQYKYFVDFTNMGTDEDGTVRPVNRG